MALHMRNSGAESGRELFKGSKNVAGLVDCTQKNFWLGVRIFISDVISERLRPT